MRRQPLAMTSTQILQLITLLEQYGPPTVAAVESVVKAIQSAFGLTDPTQAQADLTQLITDALEAKAIADKAAAGLDPQ